MGVHGLWQCIQPAERITTLQDLAVIEGYKRNSRGHHTLVVGVDTDAIMSQCIAAAHVNGHVHGPGHLQIFFFKLCKFLRSPITWVFVFDGPKCPTIKRGKAVKGSTAPSWVGPCKALIECFGFYVHQAPGEAEAELAKLNSCGSIDVILTTDSDVFVFGGLCVLRSTSVKSKPTENVDELGLYTADAIEGAEGLTLGGLLLLALLSGGDYAAGLEGCGVLTAHGLAKCGFGDELLMAFNTLDGEGLSAFLVLWVDDIRKELTLNTQGFLPSRRPALAATIPPNFPPINVVGFYVRPTTTLFPSDQPPVDWKPQPIRINKLALFCVNNLGWTDATALRNTFHSNVWEGVFLQMLVSPCLLYDPATHVLRTDLMGTTMLELQLKPRQTRRQSDIGSWYRVKVSTDGYIKLMGLNCETKGDNELKIWAPTIMFRENMAPVQNKAKKKKMTTKQATKSTTAPIPRLPFQRPDGPFPAIQAFQSSLVRGGLDFVSTDAATQQLSTASEHFTGFPLIIDLTVDSEDLSAQAESSTMGACSHHDGGPHIIDLTVENSSTRAESSAMGARSCNDMVIGGDEIIYISD